MFFITFLGPKFVDPGDGSSVNISETTPTGNSVKSIISFDPDGDTPTYELLSQVKQNVSQRDSFLEKVSLSVKSSLWRKPKICHSFNCNCYSGTVDILPWFCKYL